MGNTITAKDVTEARKTLDAAGIQSGAFSDKDIIGFIAKVTPQQDLVTVVQNFINNGDDK
jgi:hypothetical protein